MNPEAKIRIKNRGDIYAELFFDNAPNSVKSFIYLAQKGAYNQKQIKRIVPGFVIQPSYSDFDEDYAKYIINGEFQKNGVYSPLAFTEGSIGLAGDGASIASGGCFFFVTGKDIARLNGNYPLIGKITSGYDILKALEKVKTFPVDSGVPGVLINEPVLPQYIEFIEINTFGISYGPPEILKHESLYKTKK